MTNIPIPLSCSSSQSNGVAVAGGFGKIRCKASTEGCLFCYNENYWKTGKRYEENISVAILPDVDFSLDSQVKVS